MGYKLAYFNIHGLAEPIRMMLADNDIAFNDWRIEREDWPKQKPQFQFGQVPCLWDGDEQICQSGAIIRHLARVHDLGGSSESEKTFCDMFAEGLKDLHSQYTKVIYNDYENGKANLITVTFPTAFATLDKLLRTHKNGEKYVLGDKVSYADYLLFEELDIALVLEPTILDKFPLLKAFHGRMADRTKLKAYLAHRATLNIPINGNGKQ